MSHAKYISNSQQRLLRIVKALSGNQYLGLTPGELAQGLQVQPAAITRDLQNLKAAGFAEEIQELGRWRLGPSIVQLAFEYSDRRNTALAQITETDNRFTRKL